MEYPTNPLDLVFPGSFLEALALFLRGALSALCLSRVRVWFSIPSLRSLVQLMFSPLYCCQCWVLEAMELVTKGDGISVQVGLTSRAAVGVTLCRLLPGGSHRCSAGLCCLSRQLLLCGGLLWIHSSLWADLWSPLLLEVGVKEILFQRCSLESCTLPGTKHISTLVVFYEVFFRHICTLSETENCCGVVPPQHLQAKHTCGAQRRRRSRSPLRVPWFTYYICP